MTVTHEMLYESINVFVFLAVELTVLFLAISYAVGILQTKLPPEKIQKILSDKHGHGYIVAGFLGAITPICHSCRGGDWYPTIHSSRSSHSFECCVSDEGYGIGCCDGVNYW